MPKVILVVDDDALVRLGLVDLLESAGLSVVEATNADEAISVLKGRGDIKVVVTDVDMPGSMDGIKLAHFVRDKWPPIHLIVVSGVSRADAKTLPSGTLFIGKPYEDRQMLGSVRRFIDAA
jgi:CheY-like chemotaxis protein